MRSLGLMYLSTACDLIDAFGGLYVVGEGGVPCFHSEWKAQSRLDKSLFSVRHMVQTVKVGVTIGPAAIVLLPKS